ncbi:hypothetical protein GGR56DRAFT_73238 [Xylariaceae sp. FL0804]|nr:hypothetical protein GGR56DRAFT_73238 [Xylariaceae sp. FL0804]
MPRHATRRARSEDCGRIAEIEIRTFPEVFQKCQQAERASVHRGRLQFREYICCVGHMEVICGFLVLECRLREESEWRRLDDEDLVHVLSSRTPDPLSAKVGRGSEMNFLVEAFRADRSLSRRNFLYVHEICILPEDQHWGHGTELMEEVQWRAKKHRVDIVAVAEGSMLDAAEENARQRAEEVTQAESSEDWMFKERAVADAVKWERLAREGLSYAQKVTRSGLDSSVDQAPVKAGL